MSDGMRDNADMTVDTSERGIAISEIASLSRGALLRIAWAAWDAGLLTRAKKPNAAFRRIAASQFFAPSTPERAK